MRTLDLPAGATPRKWGHIHGESFRGEIKALAAIRTYLCTKVGGFANNRQVLAAARAHLPILDAYDRELYDELLGIAEGATMPTAAPRGARRATSSRCRARTPAMAARCCGPSRRAAAFSRRPGTCTR